MDNLLGQGETAADFAQFMEPLLGELLSVASNYTQREDRVVLSAFIDGPEPGYLIAVRGSDGPLPTLAAHMNEEIHKLTEGRPAPTPSAEREGLLQMMAIALEIACSAVAHAMVDEDPGVDVEDLKFKTYCYVVAQVPRLFAATEPQHRVEMLKTTLEQLGLEQQRYQLEQLLEGGVNE